MWQSPPLSIEPSHINVQQWAAAKNKFSHIGARCQNAAPKRVLKASTHPSTPLRDTKFTFSTAALVSIQLWQSQPQMATHLQNCFASPKTKCARGPKGQWHKPSSDRTSRGKYFGFAIAGNLSKRAGCWHQRSHVLHKTMGDIVHQPRRFSEGSLGKKCDLQAMCTKPYHSFGAVCVGDTGLRSRDWHVRRAWGTGRASGAGPESGGARHRARERVGRLACVGCSRHVPWSCLIKSAMSLTNQAFICNLNPKRCSPFRKFAAGDCADMGAPKPFHICPTVVAGSCEGRCGSVLQMEVAIAVEPVNTAVGTCVYAFLATNDCGHVHAPCA